ncbi:predicted protein [Uncinocarpus reesii 1704]|uniref:Altered inheritance of mitochondria protein 9, mitochondrial n=1 Tax=Uncinocarpus reesii (strain UAMH 1704) TaxID=336963 RepID=C4JWT8_UNCRE|nr:uncharacterized protein UREG_06111 [Uncinocarpus reesii 1704]EEP81246.1 predicted protein [Uncinocarpus reesii 1704]
MASLRSLLRRKPQATLRKISTTCRGKPISEDGIYHYTNGRFLVNEHYQCQRRYLKFNLAELCNVASTLGSQQSPIIAVDKLEGGFCKALIMKREDGTKLVAKLPTKIAGPPGLLTASEVATLKYVKQHTSIPVPVVLSWDCDPSNKVGSEYIIMEKAPGVQLYERWADMTGESKIALVNNLVRLESQLASIQFPEFGSLFLRDLDDTTMKGHSLRPLPATIDPTHSYCIGPSVDRSWYINAQQDVSQPTFRKGPWSSLSDYGCNLAKREIAKLFRQRRTDDRPYRRRSSEEEANDLLPAMKLVELLESRHTELSSLSRPILWHTDLHLGNIYVADNDPTQIVSIIDWQSIGMKTISSAS